MTNKRKRLMELSGRLKVPLMPVVLLRVAVTDSLGNVRDGRVVPANSPVRNFYNKLTVHHFCGAIVGSTYADGSLAVRDTSDVIQSTWANIRLSQTSAETQRGYDGQAGWYFGVIVGTDSTEHDFDDSNLGAIIAHGNGAGQLDYKNSTFSEGWNAGSSYYWTKHSRDFDNDSGGTITVNECGAVWYNDQAKYLMTIRDVIDGGQAVLDTETLTAEYEFRHYFP